LWEKAQARYQQLVYAVDGKDTGLLYGRLREINNQLQAIAAKKYKDAIALGVAYGTAGKFAEAEQAFTEALVYKPGDEQALKNIRFNKQKWFEDCVKRGDDANAAKNYIAAKGWYQQAMPMKPNDPQLQSKFNQVKKKANPLIYLVMKKKGDSAYEVNDLVVARKSYDSALVVTPKDKYAEGQLIKIDKLEEYNNIVDKANNLAAAATTVQQYDLAINEYRKALVLFPNRDYPKDQIKELILKRDSLVKKSTNVKS
jgi:tetratricopeptide (TPR) repeat protein